MATMAWDHNEQAWVGDTSDGYRVYVDGDEMSEAVAQAERDGIGSEFLYDAEEWATIDVMDNDRVRIEKISTP